MATMLPQLDFIFPHAPIEGKIAVLDHDFELPWSKETKKLPLYNLEKIEAIIHSDYPPDWTEEERKAVPTTEWRLRQRKLLSACIQAQNPWSGVSRELRKRLDQGTPVTNAFCKMYEMCFLDEVKAVLHEHGEKGTVLNATFLAEAPALFPIAVMYYLGNHFPVFLDLDKFQYRCTTLPLDVGSEAALPDQFSLITANLEHWFFMDHTSAKDTRAMLAALGAGSQDLVTGDIGKPTITWDSAERDMFREEFGQLVSACALLKDGGVAVLKMFSTREFATACMMRLATGVFGQVRIFKPLTSRPNNIETYWVLSGFKRALFDPIFESLLAVMENATTALAESKEKNKAFATTAPDKLIPFFRGFIEERNFPKEFVDKIFRLLLNQHLRNRAFLRQGLIEFDKNRNRKEDPYTIQISIMRYVFPMSHVYSEQWIKMFPVSKIGAVFYRLSKVPTPPSSSSSRHPPRFGPQTRSKMSVGVITVVKKDTDGTPFIIVRKGVSASAVKDDVPAVTSEEDLSDMDSEEEDSFT